MLDLGLFGKINNEAILVSKDTLICKKLCSLII